MCGTLCGCQVREGRPEKGGERQYEPTIVIVHGVWFVGGVLLVLLVLLVLSVLLALFVLFVLLEVEVVAELELDIFPSKPNSTNNQRTINEQSFLGSLNNHRTIIVILATSEKLTFSLATKLKLSKIFL